MDSKIKELMIEVPQYKEWHKGGVFFEWCDFEKWKAQSERVNEILGKAELFTKEVKEGFYTFGYQGLFIPLDAIEDDSFEKLARDISSQKRVDIELNVNNWIDRAKKLLGEKS